jgi:hypothetical protein
MDRITDPEVERKLRMAMIGLESRTQALFIYGALAFGTGLVMALTGAPYPVEHHFGTGIRIILGAPLFVGGILVMFGSFLANERRSAWWAAMVGMTTFTLWALAMTVSYTIAGFDQGFELAGFHTEIPADRARLYVPVFYQGVMWLAALHVVTFWRLGRPPVR